MFSSKISFSAVMAVVLGLFLFSCGEEEQPQKELTGVNAQLDEIVMGLGNVIRDSFNEIETEVNFASPNEGGVADSTRFSNFIERHTLRMAALLKLEDSLRAIQPTRAAAQVQGECAKLIDEMEKVHAENFTVVIGYLERGLDRAAKAKYNPFAELAQKRMKIESELSLLEARVKTL